MLVAPDYVPHRRFLLPLPGRKRTLVANFYKGKTGPKLFFYLRNELGEQIEQVEGDTEIALSDGFDAVTAPELREALSTAVSQRECVEHKEELVTHALSHTISSDENIREMLVEACPSLKSRLPSTGKEVPNPMYFRLEGR